MDDSREITADGEACLIAAEQVQRKLMALVRKINQLDDPSVEPNDPLPIDTFIAEMKTKKNAPRILFTPPRLKDLAWTESETAYIYAGIERAFVRAGLLTGGNRAGHIKELRKLKVWVEKQERNPTRVLPRNFSAKTALLFSEGILDERRPDRVAVIRSIEQNFPTFKEDLIQLNEWLDEDLSDGRLKRRGRSMEYQKVAFAQVIAKLWIRLTGHAVSRNSEKNFDKFVVACWKSGFVGIDVNCNFSRIIRYHV